VTKLRNYEYVSKYTEQNILTESLFILILNINTPANSTEIAASTWLLSNGYEHTYNDDHDRFEETQFYFPSLFFTAFASYSVSTKFAVF